MDEEYQQNYYWDDGWDCIIFKPGETTKTITLTKNSCDAFVDDIYAFVEFGYANRTNIDYDLIQLHFKRTSEYQYPSDIRHLDEATISEYGHTDFRSTNPYKVGHWILKNYQLSTYEWDYKWDWKPIVAIGDEPYAVRSHKRMSYADDNYTTSRVDDKLYVIEQPGSHNLSTFTYAYRLQEEDLITDGTGNFGLDMQYGAPLNVTISNLGRNKDESNTIINEDCFGFDSSNLSNQGLVQPRFGTFQTDKAIYKPGELITITVPVLNWRLLNRVYGGATGWKNCINLTINSGLTSISSNPDFDAASGTLTFRMNAVTDGCSTLQTRYVEVMLIGDLLPSSDENLWHTTPLPYLLPAGAFFSYGIQGTFDDPVWTTAISVNAPADTLTINGMSKSYQMTVDIQPDNASFHGGKWSTDDPSIATINNLGVLTVYNEGVVHVTFTSDEATYRQKNGLPANDEVLRKTVPVVVAGAKPYESSNLGFYFPLDDDAEVRLAPTLKINQSQYDMSGSRFWHVNYGKKSKVVFHHRNPELYPDIEQEFDVEGSMYTTIPFDPVTFPKICMHGNMEIGCLVTWHLPIINGVGQEMDYPVTSNIYFNTPKPKITTDIVSSIDTLDDKSLRFHIHVLGLDTQDKFLLMAEHRIEESSDSSNSLSETKERFYFSYEAGSEGCPDLSEPCTIDGITFAPMGEKRYVTADTYFTVQSVQGYDNYVAIRAQKTGDAEVNASRQWMQWADMSANPDDLLFNIDNEYYDADNYPKDNQALVDALLADFSYDNLRRYVEKSRYHYYTLESPSSWGGIDIYIDDVLTYQSTSLMGRAGLDITYPLDGKTHHVSFRWPKKGVQRDIDYTPMVPDILKSCYYIKPEFFYGKVDTDNFQFEIMDQDSVVTTVQHGLEPLFYDAKGKEIISVSISAPNSTFHSVTLNKLKPIGLSSVSVAECPSGRREYDPDDYAVTYRAFFDVPLYLRIIDANTGEQITQGVTIHAANYDDEYETISSCDSEGLFNVPTIYNTHEILADGYWPMQIDDVADKGFGNMQYNGKLLFTSDQGCVATVQLKPLSDPSGRFLKIEMEEIADGQSGEIEFRELTFDKNFTIPYDGSLDPGRKLRIKIMLDNPAFYEEVFLCLGNQSMEMENNGFCHRGVFYIDGKPYEIPASRKASLCYLVSDSAFSKINNDYRHLDFRVICRDHKRGVYTSYGTDSYSQKHYGNYTYLYAYLEANMRDFLNPEKFGPTRMLMYDDPNFKEPFLAMNNIDEDPNDIIKDMKVEMDLVNMNVKEGAEGQNLGDFQKNFEDFSIQLPSKFAFTLGVTKRNNDFLLRGIYSQSLLPDGGFSEAIDKADFLSDIDAAVYELKRAATLSDREYDPDDRMFAMPTAFAGFRAWLEGRVGYMPQIGSYGFELNGIGVKAELSGRASMRVNAGFAAFGASVSGELSVEGYLQRPSNEEMEEAGVLGKNPVNVEIGLDFLTKLKVSAFMEAGVDIFIASAKVGLKGSAWAEFEAGLKHRFWHPTLKDQYGIRFEVGANLKAYAKAHFLFWSTYKERTLLGVSGEWYRPDNEVNPLWEPESQRAPRRRLLSSYYKPLEPRRLPSNTVYLMKDVDAYTVPYLIHNGQSLLFLDRKNIEEMNDEQISVATDGEVVASFGNEGGYWPTPVSAPHLVNQSEKALTAFVRSSAISSSDLTEDGNPADLDYLARCQSVYTNYFDGSSWSSYDYYHGSGYEPRAALSPAGDQAVIWRTFDPVTTFNDNGDPVESNNGGLKLEIKKATDSYYGETLSLGEPASNTQINDYVIAMNDSCPLIMTCVTSLSDKTARIGTINLRKGEDGQYEGMQTISTFRGTMPQLIAIGGQKYVGSALVSDDDKKSDIQLFSLSANGAIADMGMLGFSNRDIIDYRLVAPAGAISADGMVLLWREAKTSDDGAVLNKLYASRIAVDADGRVFPSCPVLVLSQDDQIDISAYDAYVNGLDVKVAINVSDNETDGAHIIAKEVSFSNSVKCEYAALNGDVNPGKEIPLRFVVFNEGYQPIDYVDVTINGATSQHDVSIRPGFSADIMASAPAGTDLSKPLEFTISPTFSTTVRRTRSHAQARSIQSRSAQVSTTNSLSAAVVDMGVELFSYHSDKDKTTVIGVLSNNSPYALNPAYKVRAGIYEDAAGQHLAKGSHPQTFSQSMLYRNGNNSDQVVVLTMDNVELADNYYLCIETLDASGNVVYDQDSRNNAAMVTLYPDPENVSTDEKQQVTQIVPLSEGWNWSSLFVLNDDMSAGNVLSSLDEYGRQVKTLGAYTQNTSSGWKGSLTTFAPGEMYKVNVSQPTNWTVDGYEVVNADYPQTIGKYWNWVGVTTSYTMALEDAFVELYPEEGDIVKSQTAYSEFSGGHWQGTLSSVEPGHGYMYKSKSSEVKHFAYPERTSLAHSASIRYARRNLLNAVESDFDGSAYHAYPGNMTVTALLMDGDQPMAHTQVAVYVDGECREVQVSNGDGLVFLTIPGEGNQGEATLYVMRHGIKTEALKPIDYITDATYGSYLAPYIVQFGNASAISPIMSEQGQSCDVSPSYNVAGQQVDAESYRGVVVKKNQKTINRK